MDLNWSSVERMQPADYDGQMPIEDDFTRTESSVVKVDVNLYTCGMRGIDHQMLYKKSGSGQLTYDSESYPLYDTHGGCRGSMEAVCPNSGYVS